jgi:hypothetical protein
VTAYELRSTEQSISAFRDEVAVPDQAAERRRLPHLVEPTIGSIDVVSNIVGLPARRVASEAPSKPRLWIALKRSDRILNRSPTDGD